MNLLYFIFGILFIEFVVPIIESITSLILAWIEVSKGHSSLKITELNKAIHDLQEPNEEKSMKQIGFIVEGNEPEEEYYEEDDDE